MPVRDNLPIYPNEDIWFRIPSVVLDAGANTERLLTAADAPTFTYQLYKSGAVQGSPGTVTPSTTVAGLWEVKITAPATPGDYEIRAVVVTGTGRGEVRDRFTVSA